MGTLRRFPSAEVMVDRAISWLRTRERRPFFLWLHLMDPHSPYYPSEEAYRTLTGREISASRARYVNEFWNRSDLPPARLQRKKGSIIELYDAGIRSLDTQVARLVSHFKQSDVWDECAFAVTADHGEEFLDHGRRYHAPVNLREEIIRVPLMIRDPDSAKREVTTAPFSHLHLAPTLLDMLGAPAPATFQGISRWRNLQQGMSWEDFAISECVYGCNNPFRGQDRLGATLLSVRSARHKLVVRIEAGSVEEIYDLETDPKEERPLLSGAQTEVRGQLLQSARNHIRKTLHDRPATMRLRGRLRDLGRELQSIAS
jgi:arylsulfatase A-like enzyme